MTKIAVSLLALGLVLGGCGSQSGLTVFDVVGIEPGDGADQGLSGTFAAVVTVTSDGCEGISELDIPKRDQKRSYDVVVAQRGGELELTGLDLGWTSYTLKGSLSFGGPFRVGSAFVADAGEQTGNILFLVLLDGSFKNADEFSAAGRQRIQGLIAAKEIDCEFSFDVSPAVKKPASTTE